MKETTLILMLKIEYDNIQSLESYYKNKTNLKYFEYYIQEIEIKISNLVRLLGGTINENKN